MRKIYERSFGSIFFNNSLKKSLGDSGRILGEILERSPGGIHEEVFGRLFKQTPGKKI